LKAENKAKYLKIDQKGRYQFSFDINIFWKFVDFINDLYTKFVLKFK